MEYPIALYRVKLTALTSGSPKVDVTRIPCKRTTKQFKTAHGRVIKPEAIMKPTSTVDSRILIEYVYCEAVEQVDEAVKLLLQRAQRKADDMLTKATALHEVMNREPVVTHNEWSPDSA